MNSRAGGARRAGLTSWAGAAPPADASPWTAVSPCTAPPCAAHPDAGTPGLPGSFPVSSAGPLGATAVARRYAALAAVVGGAVAAGTRIADPAVLQRYARDALDALGVRLEVAAPGPAGPLRVPGTRTGTLIVANHTSWLDVAALLAVDPAPLTAKREVAGWPVVGTLALRTGTRFIEREALRELPGFVRDLADRLRGGESVTVFPQGTTWCTAPGGPFRRAVFQAALDAGAPVRPVALGFTRSGRPSAVPSYAGDDTLVGSLRRVARTDGLVARVRPCAPLWPRPGLDRRTLAEAAYAAVCAAERAAVGAEDTEVRAAGTAASPPRRPASPPVRTGGRPGFSGRRAAAPPAGAGSS